MSVYTTPPAWQPDAVPTPNGWKHPHRDELLVSIKLDMSLFENKVSEVEATSVPNPVEEVKAEEKPVAAPKRKKNV